MRAKIAVAVQTARETDEFKKADTEIRKALRTAGERLDIVADDVRKSDVTKDLQSQATRAADASTARSAAVRYGSLSASGARKL